MLLRTYRLNFAHGADLPTRLLVGKWGVNKSVNGDYVINETTARELPKNLHAVNFDTVDLDFEHNTVPGSSTFKAEKEPRKRAAHGPLEVVPGEGIYLHTADRWTPEGSDAAKGGHYNDLSPAIIVNKANEVVFVHSVALARHGATDDLPLQLNASDPLRTLFPEPSTATTMLDYKKLLLSLLDLPDTATDAQITAAAQKEADEPAEADSAIKTNAADIKKLSDELATLKLAAEKSERESIAARALAAGKIIPQSAMEMPLETFRKLIDELPADQVPMEKRTVEGVKTHSSTGIGQGQSVRDEIMKTMGITKEQWDKHNKTA
jgi:phage I-like protein